MSRYNVGVGVHCAFGIIFVRINKYTAYNRDIHNESAVIHHELHYIITTMHLRSIHHVLASDMRAHVAKADILLFQFQDDFDSLSIAGLSPSGVDYRRFTNYLLIIITFLHYLIFA